MLAFVEQLAWLSIPLVVLVAICAVAALGVRRVWAHRSIRAVFVVWALIGVVSFVVTLSDPAPSTGHDPMGPAVRLTIVNLLVSLIVLVPAVAAFNIPGRSRTALRAFCAVAAGGVAVPIAFAAAMILSCLFDLGCL